MNSIITCLRIIIWNSQSLAPKREEIFDFLIKNKIHLALVSETWLKLGVRLTHPDYVCHRRDRVVGEHGGVAILVHKSIPHASLDHIPTSCIETVGIKVQVAHCFVNFFSVYFPGSSDTLVLNNFKNDIIKLTSNSDNYVIGGDLNSKHTSWNCLNNNRAGKRLFDASSQGTFQIHFSPEPTHYPIPANYSPSTIDIVLTDQDRLSRLTVLNELSSDHLPVYFELNCDPITVDSGSHRFSFAKANWRKFRSEINDKISDNDILTRLNDETEIDNKIKLFTDIVKNSCENNIPKVKSTKYRLSLTDNILQLMARRNNLRRNWQMTGDPQLIREVKALNSRIRWEIRQLKNKNWGTLVKSLDKTGSGKFWKVTKFIKNKYNKIPTLKLGDINAQTDRDKANMIAQEFQKSHNLTTSNTSPFQGLVEDFCLKLPGMSHSSTTDISVDEIKAHIRSAKSTKSPGLDQISNKIIKNLPYRAIKMLAQIFQSCLLTCYFPKDWKIAKVIPIPKPDKNHSIPGNYRPISLLPCLSKLLEKCILTRLNSFIETNHILLNEQFGFRKSHSSAHQLKRLKVHVQENFMKKKSTGLVLLDIEKAFDAVWHKGLVYKMHKFGFPTYLIKVVFSFLSDRMAEVSVMRDVSSRYFINSGVPQGAVLSPTLFNIFFSDMPIPFRCYLSLFADDTALMCSSQKPEPIIRYLNWGLKKLQKYFDDWKIKVNPAKTQCIFFTRKRKHSNLPSSGVTFNNQIISWSRNVKYLGVIFDARTTFRSHVEFACAKALKFIRILYPLICRRSLLSIPNKMLLYKSIFRAILSYGIPVWHDCAKTHLLRLQRVQNKCLKLIFKLPFFYSTKKLHQLAKIESFTEFSIKLIEKFKFNCGFSDNPYIVRLG